MVRNDTDDLISFLNSLLDIDAYAVSELLVMRVPCNADLAAHPSVQVSGHGDVASFIAPGTFRVGFLGLLNGYCGVIDDGPRQGWGPILAVYDGGRLVRFERAETASAERP